MRTSQYSTAALIDLFRQQTVATLAEVMTALARAPDAPRSASSKKSPTAPATPIVAATTPLMSSSTVLNSRKAHQNRHLFLRRPLALLELVGIPQTAHQVGHNYTLNFLDNLQQNDIVHVFGNPDSLDLWRWTAGIFQGFDERGLLRVAADTYEGHSGGPVLDGRGMLIGITTLSNRNTTTLAVSAHHIGDLLQTLKPRRILSIENPMGFPMYYTIKWTPDAIWEKLVIPPNKSRISWIEMVDIAAGYPKVVFDNIADDGEFTGQINNVETYVRNFGQGVVPKPRRGATYRFEYNSTTGEIRLRKLAGDG